MERDFRLQGKGFGSCTTRKPRFRENRAIFVRVIDDSHENVYFCGGEKKISHENYFREGFTWTVMKIFIFV